MIVTAIRVTDRDTKPGVSAIPSTTIPCLPGDPWEARLNNCTELGIKDRPLARI
jgi:hypothetical protein